MFAAVFALMALLAYLSPLGLAPLVGVAGLAGLATPRLALSRSGLFGFGALFVWAAVSMAWSPARPWLNARSLVSAIEHLSLLELGLLVVVAALAVGAALGLTSPEARLPAALLRWSMLALALVLAIDSADHGAIYGALARMLQPGEDADLVRIYTARGGYTLAVLMWPWLATLSGRARWLAPAPFVAVAAVSFLLQEAAPLTAVLAGSAAFVLVLRAGARGSAVLAGLQAAYWLGAPWLVRLAERVTDFDRLGPAIRPSWGIRLGIWRFAVDRVVEHPLRGWGFDSARAFEPAIPLHPHDAALQVWLELGLPGALLVTALWLGLLRRAASTPDRLQRATAAAGATAYLTIGAVSFGVWQPWWLAVGVLAVLATVLVARSKD